MSNEHSGIQTIMGISSYNHATMNIVDFKKANEPVDILNYPFEILPTAAQQPDNRQDKITPLCRGAGCAQRPTLAGLGRATY